MKPIILFDLDGTLIDSTKAILESFKFSFQDNNIDFIDKEVIKSQIGHTLYDMFYSFGIEKNKIDKCIESYKFNYRKISRKETSLIDGVKDAIKEAKKIADLGVVTTKNSESAKLLLEHLNLIEPFKIIIGAGDVTYTKPHPEPVLKALSYFKEVDNSKTWMIGDTSMDIDAGKSANINTIAVSSGYVTYDKLKESKPTLIFKDVKEAVNHLKTLY